MTSCPLYLTSLTLYLCRQTHPIDDITAIMSMTSHPVYLWHHIHYIYDIISTKYGITELSVHDATIGICMTSFGPIISDSTSTVSVITPRLSIIHLDFIYEYTATICMTSYELPMTSHPLFMISQHAMTPHTLYSCHHSRDACHRIPCSWTITYSLLIIPHLLSRLEWASPS